MSGGSWDRLGPKPLERPPWQRSQGPGVCSICRDEGFVSESVHSVFKFCTFQHQRGLGILLNIQVQLVFWMKHWIKVVSPVPRSKYGH